MPLSPQEEDNVTLWKPGKNPFYEVYYLKWNDPRQGVAAWLRYTLLARPGQEAEASIWGVFFDAKDPKATVGLKKTYSLRETRIEREIFYFSAGPSAIYDGGARGEISNEKNKISWELKFEPGLSLRPYPSLLYLTGFPKTKYVAPFVSTRLSGEFEINGQKFLLDRVPAHQGHLWGTEHATSWVWGNCNTFEEDTEFYFDGLSARMTLGEKLSPPMTLLFFYWEGQLYSFNSPLAWRRNKSEHQLDRWHFEAGTKEILFVGDISAHPEEMVGVRYQDPTSGERFCHNTKIANAQIQILKKNKAGWDVVKTLNAQKSAAFEVVEPLLDKRVRLVIP